MPLSHRLSLCVSAALLLSLSLACGGLPEQEPLPPIAAPADGQAEPSADPSAQAPEGEPDPEPVAVVADTGQPPSATPAVAEDDPVTVPTTSGDPDTSGTPKTPPGTTKSPKSPTPAAAPGTTPAPKPSPAAPKTPKNTPPPKPSGITQVNGTTWKITRSLVNQWQDNPYKLGNVRESGEGWQLIGIRQRSAYHLGMRNSDIILEINGHKLNTQPQLLAAYLACKNDTRFDVVFLRDGRRLTHHYSIVE